VYDQTQGSGAVFFSYFTDNSNVQEICARDIFSFKNWTWGSIFLFKDETIFQLFFQRTRAKGSLHHHESQELPNSGSNF
jgi:hypothetical protein